MTQPHQALYRTYRPSTFADVTGQTHVVQTLKNQLQSDRVAHAYLFTGPRGVGKTTIARLIAKAVNCESPKKGEACEACSACEAIATGSALDIIEIDAASHTDVEHVRENIIKNVRFSPQQLKRKVFIIDEVHMLSTSAFNALLKTLEEPPEHALFVLATTEIHKVPETIVSRCQRFDFRRVEVEPMVKRLNMIVKEEGVRVDDEVLDTVARHSGGCLRDAESLLGQILAIGGKKISMEEASLVLPAATHVMIETLIEHLQSRNAANAIGYVHELFQQGVDPKILVDDLLTHVRSKLMNDLEAGNLNTIAFYRAVMEQFMRASGAFRMASIPALPIELAILDLCGFASESGSQAGEGSHPTDNGGGGTTSNGSTTQARAGGSAPKPTSEPSAPQVRPEPTSPVDTVKTEDGEAVVEPELKEDPATAPKPQAKVFDSVPVIGLDEVKNKWPQIYEQVKECNASLPLMMRSCEVSGVDGDFVELAFEYDLYVQTVNQEKHRTLIEQILETVLGKKVRVKGVRKQREDEVVGKLAEEFGGSVI